MFDGKFLIDNLYDIMYINLNRTLKTLIRCCHSLQYDCLIGGKSVIRVIYFMLIELRRLTKVTNYQMISFTVGSKEAPSVISLLCFI